jgi:hypothetical protein
MKDTPNHTPVPCAKPPAKNSKQKERPKFLKIKIIEHNCRSTKRYNFDLIQYEATKKFTFFIYQGENLLGNIGSFSTIKEAKKFRPKNNLIFIERRPVIKQRVSKPPLTELQRSLIQCFEHLGIGIGCSSRHCC